MDEILKCPVCEQEVCNCDSKEEVATEEEVKTVVAEETPEVASEEIAA